jgi:hypothetical protein
MRRALAVAGILLSLACANGAPPAAPAARYGVDADYDAYPQKIAKACLESVLKAIERGQIDYLLAHLVDPQFVDSRVKALGGNFRELVRETRARLGDDPATVKELRRFLQEGQFEESGDTVTVRLKDVKSRAVFLKQINERWYLENRQK